MHQSPDLKSIPSESFESVGLQEADNSLANATSPDSLRVKSDRARKSQMILNLHIQAVQSRLALSLHNQP